MKKNPTPSQHNFTICATGIEKMWKHDFIPIGRLFLSLSGFAFFTFLFELSLTVYPIDIYTSVLCVIGFILEGVKGYKNFMDAMILAQSFRKRSVPLTISFNITCDDKTASIEDFATQYYLDKSLREEFNPVLQKAMVSAGFDPRLLDWSVDYRMHFRSSNGGVLKICVLPAAK